MILLFPGENISHHTGTLRGSTEVLLEVERGSRTVASMGRNGEDGGGCLKIGHLHLKVALMKFLFTVIAKIHYLGLAQMVKNLPAMQETQVRSLDWEDPLERRMATHSSQSLRDLLAEVASGSLQDTQSPGVYLREDLACGAQVP